MSQDIQLRTTDNLPDLADPLALEQRSGDQAGSLFRKLHRLLRNRYKWVVLLGLIGLVGGGAAGFLLTKPLYVSRGMVHIKPTLPVVLTQTPEAAPMQGFELFVQAQASFIRSQRVLDMAMGSDAWKALGRPLNDETIMAFQENLTVLAPRGQVIFVSYTDEEPKAAAAAVRSVLEAYNRIHVEGEIKVENEKRDTLNKRQSALEAELATKREAIRQIAREYGTDDLRRLLESKLQNLYRWQDELAQLEFEVASLELIKDDAIAPTDPSKLTESEIALRDPGMRQLLLQEDNLKADLGVKLRSMGENHPRVLELRGLLAAKSAAVKQYAADYRQAVKSLPPTFNPAARPGSGLTLEQLKVRQKKFQELIAAARTETTDMGNRMLEIDKLRKDEEKVLQQLDETRRRLDSLRVESESLNQGRIQIVEYGNRPMLQKDSRIIRGIAGGVGGMGLGVGIILLIALLDSRFRSADDARCGVGKLALLGVLPSLPDNLADPEQAAIAAHCVHQIRTLLQISSPTPGAHVFAITSPAAGTGKTSLALALGVSFASANSRTLLIDCDIVGGGLTARVDTIIRRKIGQILKREGLVTQQQLDMAMKVAANSHRRLGEILVDLGFLTEADVAKALALQEETPVGMLDALNGENIDDCVAETGIRGLSILPLGAAMPSDAGRLSPTTVRKLIEEARKRYDTVLVDTGPVPGSLEASVVAAAADGVVLVVSRGEHRPLAERSLQHLHDIGAVVAGMVFNRAESRDMDLSTTTNRLSSFDRTMGRSSARVVEVVDGAEPQKLGPIALAVAGRGTAGKNGNNKQQP